MIRYDSDRTYYVLFESHLHCVVKRCSNINLSKNCDDIFEHFLKISNEIFSDSSSNYNSYDLPLADRIIAKRLKVNHYLKQLLTISIPPASYDVNEKNNLITEINNLLRVFDLLSKSIGMELKYNLGPCDEIYVKCCRSNIFLSLLIIMRFAFVTAGDRFINLNLFNFEKMCYITIDYSTSLPEDLVYSITSNQESLNTISDTSQYECFYLLKLIKELLAKYDADLSFSLPGNNPTNLRLTVKFSFEDGYTNYFHESNWLDDEYCKIIRDFTQGLEIDNDDLESDIEDDLILEQEQYDKEGKNSNTFTRIYDIVQSIPKGMVTNYGTVAAVAGNSRWARVVGYALHVNPDSDIIPCHRVVTKDGELSEAFAFGGINKQRELLEAEGVTFIGDRVDMEKHFWDGISQPFK